jgi:hypothetical protein
MQKPTETSHIMADEPKGTDIPAPQTPRPQAPHATTPPGRKGNYRAALVERMDQRRQQQLKDRRLWRLLHTLDAAERVEHNRLTRAILEARRTGYKVDVVEETLMIEAKTHTDENRPSDADAQEPDSETDLLARDIDNILVRLDIGISKESAAMDDLLVRLARQAA